MSGSSHGTEVIGFVGLGHMGGAMVRRLIEEGFAVVATDRSEAARQAASDSGATAVSTAAEVAASCSIICLSLPGPEAVVSVIDEIAEVRGKILVDFSTIGPKAAREAAAVLEGRGGRYVEAPLAGGPVECAEGRLTVLLAGDEDDIARCGTMLDALTERLVPLGSEFGSAQGVKLINNLVGTSILAACCEALVIAEKLGVSPKLVASVAGAGVSGSTIMRTIPPHVFSREFDYGFGLGLAEKDVRLCLEQVRAAGLDMPLAETVGRAYERALAILGPEADATRYVTVLEEDAGVVVRG